MKIGTVELYLARIDDLDAECVSSNLQGIKDSLEFAGGNGEIDDDTMVEVQIHTLEGSTGFGGDGWGYDFEQASTREIVYYDTAKSVNEKLDRDIAARFQERR